MKKRAFGFLLLILVLTNLLIPLRIVHAIEVVNPQDTEAYKMAEQGKERISEFNVEDEKSEYLKKQWDNFLTKNGYLDWVPKFNPIIKFFTGREFSISWDFIISILIAVLLIMLYKSGFDLILDEKVISFIAAVLVNSITVNLATSKALDFISKQVKTSIGAILLIIIIVIIYTILSVIRKTAKKIIKENRQQKTEKNIEKIEETVAKAVGISNGAKESERNWGNLNKYKK